MRFKLTCVLSQTETLEMNYVINILNLTNKFFRHQKIANKAVKVLYENRVILSLITNIRGRICLIESLD